MLIQRKWLMTLRIKGKLTVAVPRGCLQFVIVVFPDHTHLQFLHGTLCPQNRLQSSVLKCSILF